MVVGKQVSLPHSGDNIFMSRFLSIEQHPVVGSSVPFSSEVYFQYFRAVATFMGGPG
jgi:hypothetical protein